ncbi:hypothetical protein CC86DRAFT_76439 [Ophiobolus disseminans]|uniref:Uncharacterized protein n=1 Tax=Ophiobolus disseminans TaxID=1469910 RepID=A0A6A6ZPW3_9PLEO|nr:hypothetical protein CC86DRAFT_76439 [Ophiobolus disseminans]
MSYCRSTSPARCESHITSLGCYPRLEFPNRERPQACGINQVHILYYALITSLLAVCIFYIRQSRAKRLFEQPMQSQPIFSASQKTLQRSVAAPHNTNDDDVLRARCPRFGVIAFRHIWMHREIMQGEIVRTSHLVPSFLKTDERCLEYTNSAASVNISS